MPSIPPLLPGFVLPLAAPVAGFFAGGSAASLRWHFANAKGRRNLLRLWRLQELLKVAVLGEDIGESLLDNIIGTGMDEGGILIDLRCGRISQPNRGADCVGFG